MDDVLAVLPDPFLAFFCVVDVGRCEALSKSWRKVLRESIPSQGMWWQLFRHAFPAAAEALGPHLPRRCGDESTGRVCYRNLCRAEVDSPTGITGFEWDDGSTGAFLPASARESFALLVVAGPYAGVTRWGTPREFPRESDAEVPTLRRPRHQ